MELAPIATTDHAKLSNLAYASAGHTGFDSLATDQTITGQKTFTKLPAGTSFGDAPLVINPASANANERLLDVGLNGADRFFVDEDGDVFITGTTLSVGAGQLLNIKPSSYARFINKMDSGFLFESGGGAIGEYQIIAGPGAVGQRSLTANFDQYDVLMKRDVDGGGSWSEAGSVLALQRDVTNPTAENGNFLEWLDGAGATLGVLNALSNLGIGTATFGANAVRVLGMLNATAPAAAVANVSQLWSEDIAPGKASLHMYPESADKAHYVAGVFVRVAPGDPVQTIDGMMCINLNGNTIKMYAEGAWRTLASW